MDPSSSSGEPTPNSAFSGLHELQLLLSRLDPCGVRDQWTERKMVVAKPKAEKAKERNPQNEIVVLYAHILQVARQSKEIFDTHVWEEILVVSVSVCPKYL
jgi:hypothetical protein